MTASNFYHFLTQFFPHWLTDWLTGPQQQQQQQHLVAALTNFPARASLQDVLNIPLFHMLLLCNLSSTLWKTPWLIHADGFSLYTAWSVFFSPTVSSLLDVTRWSYRALIHVWVMAQPSCPGGKMKQLLCWLSSHMKLVSSRHVLGLQHSGLIKCCHRLRWHFYNTLHVYDLHIWGWR